MWDLRARVAAILTLRYIRGMPSGLGDSRTSSHRSGHKPHAAVPNLHPSARFMPATPGRIQHRISP